MFLRIKKSSGHEYLQIVENKRDGKKTRQRVVGTIGRMDELAGRDGARQKLSFANNMLLADVFLQRARAHPRAQGRLFQQNFFVRGE